MLFFYKNVLVECGNNMRIHIHTINAFAGNRSAGSTLPTKQINTLMSGDSAHFVKKFSSIISEAENYFREILNIKNIDFSKCKNTKDIDTIKNSLLDLRKLGYSEMPNSITFVPFEKESFTEALLAKKLSIPKESPETHYAYTSKGHIFINSLKRFDGHMVKHELGHYYQNLRRNSPEYDSIPKALRDKANALLNYYVDYIKAEVKPRKDEFIPEIFAKITSGEIFTDKTMLLYDIAGGPRVPNLQINGKSYENYINDLYKNWMDILGVKVKSST